MPQTGWLINNRHLFLTVHKPTIKGPNTDRCDVWWESSSWPDWASSFSLNRHPMEGVRELPGVPVTGALTPFKRAPPSRPRHLPKAHLLMPSPWGLDFTHEPQADIGSPFHWFQNEHFFMRQPSESPVPNDHCWPGSVWPSVRASKVRRQVSES